MPSILIAFATYREAQPTLNALDATSCEEGLFSFSHGYILVTGMGMLAAAAKASRTLPLVDEVWNFGIAGSLSDTLPLESICEVHTVSKFLFMPGDTDPVSKQIAENTFPSLSLPSKGCRLLSSDFPIHSASLRRQLTTQYDLVDMEGYGIAFAAEKSLKPCRIWKFVSDLASPGGRELLYQYIDKLSTQASDLIVQLLTTKV